MIKKKYIVFILQREGNPRMHCTKALMKGPVDAVRKMLIKNVLREFSWIKMKYFTLYLYVY